MVCLKKNKSETIKDFKYSSIILFFFQGIWCVLEEKLDWKLTSQKWGVFLLDQWTLSFSAGTCKFKTWNVWELCKSIDNVLCSFYTPKTGSENCWPNDVQHIPIERQWKSELFSARRIKNPFLGFKLNDSFIFMWLYWFCY